jgi:putative ABC transport system permease protein
METFLQDFRLAIRMLVKKPGFTVVAVITLALGIAVNATIFSLVSAFLLRRPPGREPEQVVAISSTNAAQTFQADVMSVSPANYMAWRGTTDVFADMAAADEYRTVSLTSGGQPESLRGAAVSPNYFRVFGVSPSVGRDFSDGEDHRGRDHVVVLSEQLWKRRFGSDPKITGSTVRLDRENYVVVGVMPENFRLLGFTPQLWTPLVLDASDQTEAARKNRYLYLFARLKAGASAEKAQTEMAALAARTAENFPETEKGWGVAVRTLPDYLVHRFNIRAGLAVLMATVGFVLMIACANVAGLLLARAAGRRKELGIRIALGAGRWRVVRQLLTEGLVIAVLGGGVGLLLTYWGVNFLRANVGFNDEMSAVPLRLDWNVLLFVLGVSMVSAVLCALAPAIRASRTDVNTSLKEESRAASASRSHNRLRTVLVTGEIALALFLLIGTGILIKGLVKIEHQDLGFQPQQMLTAGVTLDDARYKDPAKQAAFAREALRQLEQIPGAQGAAITADLPATGPGSVSLRFEGREELPAGQKAHALDFVVSSDYLRVAGVPLLRGRTFTDRDNAGAPRVVLVNAKFVERYMPGQEPLGKRIRIDAPGVESEWSEIVGVAGNVKSYAGSTRDDPEVYEVYWQRPVASMSFMLRADSDPSGLAAALRGAMAQVDQELPVSQLMSMTALLERQNGGDRFFGRVLGGFAMLALLLSAIGIYGLVAYSVSQRAHEIGIRMALGAGKSQVLRMVLGEGLRMTAVGGAIGIAMALPLPKLFGAIFIDMHVHEPAIYLVVPAAIVVVAMVATLIPARRATRVDPMAALRHE